MDHPDFSSPNLYDLSLALSAEPGLEAWWNTVVQIMAEYYKAERITLSVPADSTDLQNVPWGQKATYNATEGDELSLQYMGRGSSVVPTSKGTTSIGDVLTPASGPKAADAAKLNAPKRPGMQSRHSFTSYENEKQDKGAWPASSPITATRPGLFPRSQSYYPGHGIDAERSKLDTPHMGLNRQSLMEHDAEEGEQEHVLDWQAPLPVLQNKGRVLNLLQSLDYEADPLIDHHGVTRVLERGRVIALTRTYPYLADAAPAKAGTTKSAARSHSPEGLTKIRKPRSESSSKLSTILGSVRSAKQSHDRRTGPSIEQMLHEEKPPRPPTPKYEEYEQAPPSPWSQSPAPSPAIRADPKENPFFTEAVVDEGSFDPGLSPQDYSTIGPQEAIGVDNSWTVLHVPLPHILLSKPSGGFKLDSTLMEQKSSHRGKDPDPWTQPSPDRTGQEKQTPIAILSILSPTIPYPSNLRHSLQHLAPHLATSFSLCRHYSNLEAEISGIHRRKPRIAGFGGVDVDGRLVNDPTVATFAASEESAERISGSVTSPSDYSAPSRSTTGTPGVTPGWDSHGFGQAIADKRPSASSPAPSGPGGDSYFATMRTASKTDLTPVTQHRARPPNNASEKRSSLRLSGGILQLQEPGAQSPGISERDAATEVPGTEDASLTPIPTRTKHKDLVERRDERVAEQKGDATTPGQMSQRHKTLHSYGGDLASTFQMLPPGSNLVPRGMPSRSDSFPVDPPGMALPSDRLKGLILDSLPAHIFVALPPNGAMVYVNSNFLTYRGQTLTELSVDPFVSIHPDDREAYLKAWSHSIKTGDNFARQVRIRRFDGAYRWFHAKAVASRNRRNEVVQFLGSYMDVHEQYMAELKAARQQEVEESEAKHRLLANLIPQIIFTATEDDGITFANEQWLSYTGQSFDDALGLGFMDFVHPDDLSKCRIPNQRPPTPLPRKEKGVRKSPVKTPADQSSTRRTSTGSSPSRVAELSDKNIRGVHHALSRRNSSSSESMYEVPTGSLSELTRKGVVKVATDTNGRLSYTTEMRLRSKKGEYRWHLVRCVEIDNTSLGRGVSSYFGSATDINDHKLLEEKLKEAMESKSRFLSNMSHEIRTPLIGISGMVSFLQDTTLNEEQRDYTNTIQTSANSLLMIINDILDLSKVDAGMMKLNFEWFHTRSLIEDVNELVSTMAIAKRLELNYIVDEEVPTWIKGDRVRIRQVLLNVIGNAIKFTQTGEVFSRCRVKTVPRTSLDEHQIMLEFAVIDTGRGFNEEEAKLIFRPFSQIDGSSTRVHGGSGLGLVISRQLVELHGGHMNGTAVPDEGATFTFTAKFGLPTPDDHPDAPISPREIPRTPAAPEDIPTQPFRQFAISKPLRPTPPAMTASPIPIEHGNTSPAVMSSGSSNPSVSSTGTRITERSSMSSVNAGLVRFSEAARASGQDLSQLKLEMPSGRSSPGITPTPDSLSRLRPPMFSILVICPQRHSREATTMHIEMTLPKDVPHQITALATAEEARELIGREDPVIFTHVVINLPSALEIFGIMDEINRSAMVNKTTILILSDSVQRQALVKLVADTGRGDLLSESKITYIYKPVKPSRFAVIFDPANERDLSIDRNRSTAQRIVETQKQSYLDVEKRMGNKGYKVLLVEDNLVNQKVLTKYLEKVGLEVDLAKDGVECTDKVFAHRHGYFSLILVSKHPTRTDIYNTRLTLYHFSVTYTCHGRTATRPVVRFETGSKRTGTMTCPSLRSLLMSCPTSRRSALRRASAIMSQSLSISSICPRHYPSSSRRIDHSPHRPDDTISHEPRSTPYLLDNKLLSITPTLHSQGVFPTREKQHYELYEEHFPVQPASRDGTSLALFQFRSHSFFVVDIQLCSQKPSSSFDSPKRPHFMTDKQQQHQHQYQHQQHTPYSLACSPRLPLEHYGTLVRGNREREPRERGWD